MRFQRIALPLSYLDKFKLIFYNDGYGRIRTCVGYPIELAIQHFWPLSHVSKK